MKRVYQTIVGNGQNGTPRGNCMQATVASLLELELEDVPNFIELDKGNGEGNVAMWNFFMSKGYDPSAFGCFDTKIEEYLEEMQSDGGIDGYFYASINSPSFEGTTHAVIVNKRMIVVHDPNPNEKALGLDASKIINYIITFN